MQFDGHRHTSSTFRPSVRSSSGCALHEYIERTLCWIKLSLCLFYSLSPFVCLSLSIPLSPSPLGPTPFQWEAVIRLYDCLAFLFGVCAVLTMETSLPAPGLYWLHPLLIAPWQPRVALLFPSVWKWRLPTLSTCTCTTSLFLFHHLQWWSSSCVHPRPFPRCCQAITGGIHSTCTCTCKCKCTMQCSVVCVWKLVSAMANMVDHCAFVCCETISWPH